MAVLVKTVSLIGQKLNGSTTIICTTMIGDIAPNRVGDWTKFKWDSNTIIYTMITKKNNFSIHEKRYVSKSKYAINNNRNKIIYVYIYHLHQGKQRAVLCGVQSRSTHLPSLLSPVSQLIQKTEKVLG